MKKARVAVYLSPEVAVKSLEKAYKRNLTRSAVIQQLLEEWMEVTHFGNDELTLCGERSEVTADIAKVDCPQCRRILSWHLKEVENGDVGDRSA